MEYTFCGEDLQSETWQVLGTSMLHNYTMLIMPQFSVLMEMSPTDFAIFCQLSCHYVSFFRSCFAMKLSSEHGNEGVVPYLTSLSQQVGHTRPEILLLWTSPLD